VVVSLSIMVKVKRIATVVDDTGAYSFAYHKPGLEQMHLSLGLCSL
jgi:hypothetical protein